MKKQGFLLTYPEFRAEKTLVPYMIAKQGGSRSSVDKQWPDRTQLWDIDAWEKHFRWVMRTVGKIIQDFHKASHV